MTKTIKEQLNDFKGSQIIGLDTKTTPKLKGGKSNPLAGRITKIVEGSVVMVFKSSKGFKNMVNRRLAKQVILTDDLLDQISGREYQPGPRPWGQRVKNTPFVLHKGKDYLECIFLKSGEVKYFVDGKEVEKSEIDEHLYKKKEGDQGGLVDKVIIRTYSLDSIIKVRKGQKEILGPAITTPA